MEITDGERVYFCKKLNKKKNNVENRTVVVCVPKKVPRRERQVCLPKQNQRENFTIGDKSFTLTELYSRSRF